MNYKKILFAALIIGLSSINTLWGQVGMKKLGQSTMNFLEVSLLPKATAMGGAFTAVGYGAESIFYNPAGLAMSDRKFDAVLTTVKWIADINYTAGALSWNMGNMGTVGLNLLTVDYGDIYGTRLLSSTSAQGYEDIGMLDNVGAYAIGLSYSRKISNQFSMGGSVQFVGQNLGSNMMNGTTKDNSQTNVSFNMGVLYYPGFKSFRFGMSIRNFAPSVKYEEVSAVLPTTFTMGAAMDILDIFMQESSKSSQVLLSIDFLHPNNYTERVNFGAEYSFIELLSIRAGYQFNRDLSGLTAGFGITPTIAGNELEFSYAYEDIDLFDSVNRFSIRLRF